MQTALFGILGTQPVRESPLVEPCSRCEITLVDRRLFLWGNGCVSGGNHGEIRYGARLIGDR